MAQVVGPFPCSSPLNSRHCAQGHAGARAVKRLRITPSGTPGLSRATASALALTTASISARICLITSSSGGIRFCFITFDFLVGAGLRWWAGRKLLPGGSRLILSPPQRFLSLRLVRGNKDLQIVGKQPKALFLRVRPRA